MPRYLAALLSALVPLTVPALDLMEPSRMPKPDQAPVVQEVPPGGEFTLHSADGPVSLKDFRGKPVFLYFGYSKCPDICPTSLATLGKTLHELSEAEQQQVAALFVSVDPQRDSTEALKAYAGYFHPNLVGVTGSDDEVAAVAWLYGARYYQVELEGSPFGYAVNHSSATYLLTAEGELRFIFPYRTPSEVMLEAVRYLLAGN